MNTKQNIPKVIALYLPQYHPIPENDEWWEKGFTEWTNVTKAKPLYRGHQQPDLPSELGFYDLRLSEVREQQANLAREFGVYAFCYYHYWFGEGKTLLDKPFNDVLKSGKPNFPFMLCWANGTWSGIWHGLSNRTLIEQKYPGIDDAKSHFMHLLPALKDPRYIKIDGKPVFMIYRPIDIPSLDNMISLWRSLAIENGLEGLYLIAENSDPFWNANKYGFDSFVNMRDLKRRRQNVSWKNPLQKIHNIYLDITKKPTILKFSNLLNYFVPSNASPQAIPCVIPNWDNTPRSGWKGLVIEGSSAENFEYQLKKSIKRLRNNPLSKNIIFIKSWNEWAEGNYLEPSRKHGRKFLESLRNTLNSNN
jgi:Glycosyltransferase WbsX